jgi:2-oxoglutarate dehydrogenase E1 component
MNGWQDIKGINAGYLADLYERYRQDPASVDPQTRAAFERGGEPVPIATTAGVATRHSTPRPMGSLSTTCVRCPRA